MRQSRPRRQVDAEAETAFGRVTAVRNAWAAPIDSIGIPETHWLEMSLLPGAAGARACYPQHWPRDRFERIGGIFFMPARREVHARSDCRTQRSVVAALRPEAIAEWLEEEQAWSDGRLLGGLDVTSPVIRQLMLRLERELRAPGFGGAALIELVTAQIAIELGRYFGGIGQRGGVGGLAPWRLCAIADRLAEGPPPSLAELAGICGLSVRQLARGYRASRGRSIGAAIGAARLARAERLLSAGESVKRVAHAAGFASPSAFSVAFRRATGRTPGAHRPRD